MNCHAGQGGASREGDHHAASLVLLVSVDEDALAIFGAVLRHSGFGVRELRDPAAVLDVVEREPPALVVTNFPLSAGDATVTSLLRGNERMANVPILNVTSHVMPHELAGAQSAGVTASVPMPVDLRELVAEVERLLCRGLGGP